MKKLIAKIFGLYTKEQLGEHRFTVYTKVKKESREFYQGVIDAAHRNGSLPPNTDLKTPKATLVISNLPEEDGRIEVIARDGKWYRLPLDGEKVVITYAKNL